MSELYEPLTQKYRPRRLEEMIGQDTAQKIVAGMFQTRKIPRAILISGIYSSGKTTLARIIARYLNCQGEKVPCGICQSCLQFEISHSDIHEIDAASQRGIDDIRELQEVARLAPRFNYRVFILDECYPGETRVLVDYDKAVSIQQIVEDKSITHVLAYDLEKKQIIKKEITNRYRRPYHEHMYSVYFDDDHFFECTHKQELYVAGKGYIPVDEIVEGDQLIQYAGTYEDYIVCPYCHKLILKNYYAGHLMSDHRENTSHPKYTESRKGVPLSEETCHKISMQRQIYYDSPEGQAFVERLSKEREGENNPIFRYMTPAEVSEKHSKRQKAWWQSMSEEERSRRIKTFVNAPIHRKCPNNVEQFVQSFNIDGLKFVGDGSLFMTLTTKEGLWHKNPDFVYKEEGEVKKVVEVMDLEYWHTPEEAQLVRNLYKNIGYDCLIVDAARVHTHASEVKAEIEAFCHNHYIEVKKIEVARNVCRGREVFDIEVAEAHNFFIVSGQYGKNGQVDKLGPAILSSNCHQLSPQAFRAFLKTLEEPPAKTVFILVTTRPNQLPDTIRSRCSPISLNPVSAIQTAELLLAIAKKEGILLPEASALKMANAVDGHPRNALMLLEQASHYLSAETDIDSILPQLIEHHLKLAPRQLIEVYAKRLATKNLVSCLRVAQTIADQHEDFLKGVIAHYVQIIYSRVATEKIKLVDYSYEAFLQSAKIEVPELSLDLATKQLKVLESALRRIRQHEPDPTNILILATLEAIAI